MKTQPNQDAFGHSASWNNNGEEYDSGSPGLTKREYFAAKAFQGLLASGKSVSTADSAAVVAADALIAALNRIPE